MDICKDISVVIQGPLDDRTYQAIDQYQYFNEVIVSTWDNDDVSLLDKANGSFKVVKTTYKEVIPMLVESQIPSDRFGQIYHAFSTLRGAVEAKSKYVLKTRSDELYPDLTSMLSKFSKHPNKSHTTDNGFWKQFPCCYSNHLFLDATEYVVEAMLGVINYHFTDKQSDKSSTNGVCLKIPESQFGFFLMKSRRHDIGIENWKQVFVDNICITPCKELIGHLHSGCTLLPQGFKRSSEPYPLGRRDMHNNKHDINNLCQKIEDIL